VLGIWVLGFVVGLVDLVYLVDLVFLVCLVPPRGIQDSKFKIQD